MWCGDIGLRHDDAGSWVVFGRLDQERLAGKDGEFPVCECVCLISGKNNITRKLYWEEETESDDVDVDVEVSLMRS